MPMIETRANGQPAFGLYMRTPDGDFEPFHLQVLRLDGDTGRATSARSSTRGCSRRSGCRRGCRPATSPVTRCPTERRPRRPRGPGPTRSTPAPTPARRAPSSCWSGRSPTRGSCSPASAPTSSTGPRPAPGGRWPACSPTWRTRSTRSPRPPPGASRSRPCPADRRPGRAPCARRRARCSAPGPRPGPVDGARSATVDLDAPAAGRDRRPRDHRARLGRRPGDRAGHADPRRPGPRAAAGRRQVVDAGDRGTRFAGPARRRPTPPDARLLAFLGRSDGST